MKLRHSVMVAGELGCDFDVISRSDSTLRGRFPGLPYVVFPGNVGTDDSLAQEIEILRTGTRP